jgi:4-amino-4-deoxy-L-arabinose transferase-like glycosyltransferase
MLSQFTGRATKDDRLDFSFRHPMLGDLNRTKIVQLFLVMLALKAIIALVIFPAISQILGSNYHSELFPDDYDSIAQNLATGNGYRVYMETSPTMLRSPGFVVLLAGIFYLFGKSLFAVQVVQYFMSAGTAIFVYLIAQRLIASPLVSLTAAAIYLFHPVVVISDSRGGVDTTLMLCMAAAMWLLYRAIDREHAWDFILLGLVVGYTMLVKATVALIFPAVLLYLLLSPLRQSSVFMLLRNFTVAGFVAGLVMMPWIVRNYELSGDFVPTMTVGGLAVFQGIEVVKHDGNGEDHRQLLEDAANEQVRIGKLMNIKMREAFFPQFYDIHDEVKFYDELGRRAWAEYKADPILLVRAIIHNSWAFWLQGRTETATILNIFIMVPFLFCSALGAVTIIRYQPMGLILVIAVVAFMLPHLVIIALARHCSTVIPLMSVLAAGCLLAPFSFSARVRPSGVG